MTPQYAGLRTLHKDNAERGFAVLAFPCNQFAGQEPGTDAEILEFATTKYQINFPMFSKIEVNGDGACDLYQWLKAEHAGQDAPSDVAWNFEKFLIDRSGRVVARFGPTITPEEIAPQLEQYLAE